MIWRLPPTAQGMGRGKVMHVNHHGWTYVLADERPLACAVAQSIEDLEQLGKYTKCVRRMLDGPMINYIREHRGQDR